MMTPFGYLVDSVVHRITLTFLDSGSVLTVMQRVVGQCDAIATGAEHDVLKLLLVLLLGILVGVEGVAKALLAGTLLLDLSTCRPRLEPRIVPPRGPPGAGVGTPPKDADSAALPGDLLGALKLLQTVMSEEDFSKYEKLVAPPSKEARTKQREQLLWEKVQSQNRLRKQETGHVEQSAKLEADVAKQRAMGSCENEEELE